MRQPTDRDQIDAGFSDLGRCLRRDPARGLGDGAARNHRHGLSQLIDRHVVEQERVGAKRQRFFKLRQGIDFQLDLDEVADAGAGPLESGANAPRQSRHDCP